MGILNKLFGWVSDYQVVESTKAFKGKGDDNISDKFLESVSGEGVDDITYLVYGRESAQGFNRFYNEFINKSFNDKRAKISNYRLMSEMPEISSVIEDITIESTQENEEGKILELEILNQHILDNENIMKNLNDEFDEIFHKRFRISKNIIDYFRSYYIDAEIYLEKIIQSNKKSKGLVALKKLPTETMDCFTNPTTGKIEWYYQILSPNAKTPQTFEDAEKEKDIIVFYPEQIAHIDYGVYIGSKKNVQGYLEKAKQPFNQLKLLETSVIIYRIVKAPERLVFKIDTGAMPRDKSLKFVESIKKKLTQKVEFDSASGQLKNQTDVMSMMDNYFLPQCLTLDTKISCLDGQDKPLSQMIEEFKNGIINEVISVDQSTGRLVRGEVEWAGITRRNTKVVRVHFDNDTYVTCTPDHKFVMKDGTEIQARDLQENFICMSYLTDMAIDKFAVYKRVFDPNKNEWVFIHKLLKPTDNNKFVYHKDHNILNNTLDNLEIAPIEELERRRWADKKERDNRRDFLHNVRKERSKEDIKPKFIKVKYVETIEETEDTGCLTIKDANSNHNFPLSNGVFVKNSADGRGSSVESIGGDPSGFSQLDDIYYFARKLYISLKYPITRVINQEERRTGDSLFMGGNSSEITIDEIRWAKFLESHQQKFCDMFADIFLLHLEFKGLKAEYEIDINDINVLMTPPNNYKSQMQQLEMEKLHSNYTNLSHNEEFSKYFLMKKYLKWSDEEIEENAKGFEMDRKYLPKPDF